MTCNDFSELKRKKKKEKKKKIPSFLKFVNQVTIRINLPVEQIRMFDVFPSKEDHTSVPHFNKCCALTNFYSKTLSFVRLLQNAFSEII